MALPLIESMYPRHTYTITYPKNEGGAQDVTVRWKNGDAARIIEVKGSNKDFDHVFWTVSSFDFDNVPSPTATTWSYKNGDVVSGVPSSLEGCDTIYFLNAERDRDGKFMPDVSEFRYAVKWKKVRDYGMDLLIAGMECNSFWYATSDMMLDRFRGYAWHTQGGTTGQTTFPEDKDVRPRLMALFDFDGIPYATLEDNGKYLWHGIYPPGFIMV